MWRGEALPSRNFSQQKIGIPFPRQSDQDEISHYLLEFQFSGLYVPKDLGTGSRACSDCGEGEHGIGLRAGQFVSTLSHFLCHVAS